MSNILFLIIALENGLMSNMQIEMPLKINLELHSKDSEITAMLTFENHGNASIFLDKISIGLTDKLKRNVFEIKDENGDKVSYTGYMMKRKITENDFIELKPGEKVSTSIVLNLTYKILPNTKYNIKYSVRNPSHPNGQASFLMETNEAKFVTQNQ